MSKYKIGSLILVDKDEIEELPEGPVVEKRDIVGVITESDIIRKVVATGLDPSQTNVEDAMSKNVITIDGGKGVDEACHLMVDHKIKRLPVIDDGKLVGIITTTDIISVEPKLMEELGKIMLFQYPDLLRNQQVLQIRF